MIYIHKKDGTTELWNSDKIINAIRKSADRVMTEISDEDGRLIVQSVINIMSNKYNVEEDVLIPVEQMHYAVEAALEQYDQKIAKSYKD